MVFGCRPSAGKQSFTAYLAKQLQTVGFPSRIKSKASHNEAPCYVEPMPWDYPQATASAARRNINMGLCDAN